MNSIRVYEREIQSLGETGGEREALVEKKKSQNYALSKYRAREFETDFAIDIEKRGSERDRVR